MSTERYLVTARKYRPQLFGELVAQEHVTETLKNALRLDRLAHAYLFSGPRGVGKTTAARILAKAINCTTPPEERIDATEPCRACDSCRSFEAARSLNIIEIDAASNNKVDDIRELRDTVRIPPQGSRKKVYIVDEVHMLSTAAFNALLKTLEEPPPYVLFIFATTEPNKVLPTILSRCQRFDFRRIAVPEIVARLQEICATEHITADEASLLLIARKGDGALRDALSAFDQAVSLCGADLRYGELAQAMGIVEVDLFFDVTEHVRLGSGAGMLHLVEHLMRAGYDLQEFLAGLAEHLRNLLVAVTMPDASLIEATESTRQRYREACRHFSEPDLLRLLMIVAETEEALKNSVQPRLRVEMALLKMASLPHAADLRETLRKLDRLEALVREGQRAAATGAPAPPPDRTHGAKPRSDEPARPARAVREDDLAYEGEPAMEAGPADEPSEAPPVPARVSTIHRLPRRDAETEAPEPEPAPEPAPAAPTAPPPRPADPARPPALYPGLFGQPALGKKAPPAHPEGRDETDAQNLFAGSGALAAAPARPHPPEAAPQPVAAVWPRYVQAVKSERIHVGSLLQQGTPAALNDGVLTVAVPDAFHQRLLENQQAFLQDHLARLVDVRIEHLEFVIRADVRVDVPQETRQEVDPHEYMQRKRQESPVIRAIFEHFGGELVW